MVGEEVIDSVILALLERFAPFVTVLKAAGIVFIVYVIYLIIKVVLNWKNRNRIKRIEKKVSEIDEKLDKILAKVSKKDRIVKRKK